MNCGWLKGTFWRYVTIHGLDNNNNNNNNNNNTMFRNVKRVLFPE